MPGRPYKHCMTPIEQRYAMIRIKHFPYRGKRQLTIFGGLEHRYQHCTTLRNEFGPRLPLQSCGARLIGPKKVDFAAAGPAPVAGLLLNRY